MNIVSRLGLSLTIVAAALFGCAPQDAEDSGEGQGAASAGSSCAANVDINFTEVRRSKPAPADTIDTEFNPDFKTCETNIQLIQVTGTAHDKEINKLLGSDLIDADPPCEGPETVDGSVTLKFLAHGILSTAGPSSWYGGGAHPSFGIEYKNIDLKTGKAITLDKIVKEEARATIVRSLKAQIGVQREPAYDAEGKPVRTASGKQAQNRIDEDTKRSLLSAVDYAFGAETKLADIHDFTISSKGIRFDLVNQLPHAVKGVEASYLVRFETLNGKLVADSPVQRLIAPQR